MPFGDGALRAEWWASQNCPSALTLNKSAFGKAAKVLELPFVVKKTEMRAQIASDLSAYLTKPDEQS